MGTRLYPTANVSGAIGEYRSPNTPSSYSAGWNKTTSVVGPFLLLPTGRCQAVLDAAANAASGTSGHFTAVLRTVSPPLLADHSFSGTVKGQFRCRESAATDNYTLAFALKVIQPDGTDRGVLVAVSASDDTSATPPEMAIPATGYQNRKLRDSAESASITLGSVSAQRGDMIVLELGFRQASTSVANGEVVAIAGQASDLAEDDTSGNNDNGWIEFSQTLPEFGPNWYGFAATPADGAAATGTADPTAITLPAGMTTADLVVMVGHQRATGATLAVSAAGGQSWTALTAAGTTNVTFRPFWAQFDGTWDTNPSVDFSATTCNSVQGLVFRGPAGCTWSENVAISTSTDATDPFTITGQTTTGNNGTVTLAGWASADDNTYGAATGTGWATPGTAQYRNTSGSDQASSYAYKVQAIAGATGNVEKSQTANGADTAATFIITFAAALATPAAALTGTITAGVTEADIVAGGKTSIITLTNDTWIAAGVGSFDLQRDEIIAGFDSAQSEATGWDLVPKATQSLGGVVRTSDTVVTVTWDAFATYDITANETITVTVPGTAVASGSPIVATPTFVISATAAPTKKFAMLGVG
jgi:hypothetical protein